MSQESWEDKPPMTMDRIDTICGNLREHAAKAEGASTRYVLRTALEAIEFLLDEGSKLSAGVCEHRSGDDHGNPLCLATGKSIPPRYDATQRPINTSHASMDNAGKVTLHLDAAANGDPSNEIASTPRGIL